MDVAGSWRGEYLYNATEGAPRLPAVPFSMTIDRSWFGSFAGVATDHFAQDLPNRALIQGRAKGDVVTFRKTPQAFLTLGPKGFRPVSEFFQEEFGTDLEVNYPPPHILYRGVLDPTGGRMSGTWVLPTYKVILPKLRKALTFHETRGTWWAARASGGPTNQGGG